MFDPAKEPDPGPEIKTTGKQEEKKPEDFKPNRAQRRLMRAKAIKLMSARRRILPLVYKCGVCKLRFVAPVSQRCQCKVAKPRGASVDE